MILLPEHPRHASAPVRTGCPSGSLKRKQQGNRWRPEALRLERRILLTGIFAQVFDPGGVATDSSGNVYISDVQNSLLSSSTVVQKFSPGGQLLGTATVTCACSSIRDT